MKKLFIILLTFALSCNTSKKIDLAVAKAMDKYEHQPKVAGWGDDGIVHDYHFDLKYPFFRDTISHLNFDSCGFTTITGTGTTKEVDSIGVFIWNKQQ